MFVDDGFHSPKRHANPRCVNCAHWCSELPPDGPYAVCDIDWTETNTDWWCEAYEPEGDA